MGHLLPNSGASTDVPFKHEEFRMGIEIEGCYILDGKTKEQREIEREIQNTAKENEEIAISKLKFKERKYRRKDIENRDRKIEDERERTRKPLRRQNLKKQ